MRIISLLGMASLLFVAGCSTPGGLRGSVPDLNLTSGQSAKQVAICIADAWENGSSLGVIPISIRPTQSGYSVMWRNGAGSIGMLVDVNENGTGSTTKYYRSAVIGSSSFESSVEKCQ